MNLPEKNFVGRKDELELFKETYAGVQSKRLLHFWGGGGIGKTSLLQQIYSLCLSNNWQTTGLIDFFDIRNRSRIGLMLTISDLLGTREEFDEFRVSVGETSRPDFESLPVFEEVVLEKFIDGYHKVTQIRQKPIVLLIDTVEIVQNQEVVRWFLCDLCPKIREQTIVVMAGRQLIIEPCIEWDLFSRELQGLSLIEVEQFAHRKFLERDVEYDTDLPLSAIHKKTLGRPILIILAIEWILEHGKADVLVKTPLSEFEQQLVVWLRDLKSPEDIAVLYMSVVDKRFDVDLMSYLLKMTRRDAEKTFEKLARYSFVKYRPTVGICTLHDEMRYLVNKYIGLPKEMQNAIAGDVSKYYEDKIQYEEDEEQRKILRAEQLHYRLMENFESGFDMFIRLYERNKTDPYFCELILGAVDGYRDLFTTELASKVDDCVGRMLTRRTRLLEARQILLQALARPGLSQGLRANLLLSLSNNANNDSEFEQAYEFAENALKVLLDLIAKGDIQHQQALAQAYRLLGLNSRVLGDYDIAIKWFLKSLDEVRKREDQRGYAATLNNIGNVYRLRGDLNMARKYVEKGLGIRRDLEIKRPDINIKHEINLSLMTLGLVARDEGRIQDAVKYFQEAENLARSTKYQLDLAGAFRNLGDTLYWQEGIFYLEPEHYRRRELADEFDVHVDEGSIIHKLLIQGKDYLDESQRILRSIKQRNELAKTLNALARLHMNLLEWLEAETYLKESLELANETKDRYLESDNLVSLIALNYFTNTEDETPPYLNQLEVLWKNHIFHDLKARLELVLGNIEYDQERYEKDEALYQAAFIHYAEACKHMLLHNAQRYQVCLETLKKRLTAISVPVIKRKVCATLIEYWLSEKLDEKDLGVIQLAELEM